MDSRDALSRTAVDGCMARGAECDQIFFGIQAGVAAESLVVHLKIRHRAARLTAPAIATQDLLP